MKKILMVLGIVALLLIIFAAASVNYVAFRGRQLDASSKTYVDASILAIISTWSADELLKRSSAEFREATNEKDLNLAFSKLKQLGMLQKYEGSKGESSSYFNYKNAKVTKRAYYNASATFQNGTADMQVGLIQKSGQWQIDDFRIDSPIFSK
jgi:hypothetical protein